MTNQELLPCDYTKKPVTIQAIKWDGKNTMEVLQFMGQTVDLTHPVAADKFYDFCQFSIKDGLNIATLEDGNDNRANHVATVGDYIVKGIAGEFYPCKPDIFKATYSEGSHQSARHDREVAAKALDEFAFSVGPFSYYKCKDEGSALVRTRTLLRNEAARIRAGE